MHSKLSTLLALPLTAAEWSADFRLTSDVSLADHTHAHAHAHAHLPLWVHVHDRGLAFPLPGFKCFLRCKILHQYICEGLCLSILIFHYIHTIKIGIIIFFLYIYVCFFTLFSLSRPFLMFLMPLSCFF